MKNCVFCKIVKGDIPSIKTWEDKNFLAILDINPNTKGMTLVLTKKHYNSYVFEMPNEEYTKFMLAAKKVSKILEKGLDVKRVALVMEGMGVNHAHLKLYPLYGIDKKFKEIGAKERVFFKKYKGYISTQLGPPVSEKKLKEIAKKIQTKTKKVKKRG